MTDGVLGVAQDRVEMVMKQALPVMGGMASQNVLNLADSVMVGRLGTACVRASGSPARSTSSAKPRCRAYPRASRRCPRGA